MKPGTKVVVAMSGGVDSSVAAALLKQQGYEVIGMMMRLWTEPGRAAHNRCCTPASMALARRVAAELEIPFYAVDAQKVFHDTVVNYFIDGYTQGLTPNPCLACNRHIRWEFLLNRALALGADYMATGHYARLVRQPEEPVKLLRAVDGEKDQSYILSVLSQEQLQHARFPLGEHTKLEVRQLARQLGLPAAESKESQDLCFLADTDYRSFLQRNAPQVENPGPIVNRNNEVIGQHQGLAFYTIGQRKGLGLASLHPVYVLEKDLENNALVVGRRAELGNATLIASGFNWISGQAPPTPIRGQVKIRYKSPMEPATISPNASGEVHIQFDQPLNAVTPGQAAVVYDGDEVLGGGVIRPAASAQAIPLPLQEARLQT